MSGSSTQGVRGVSCRPYRSTVRSSPRGARSLAATAAGWPYCGDASARSVALVGRGLRLWDHDGRSNVECFLDLSVRFQPASHGVKGNGIYHHYISISSISKIASSMAPLPLGLGARGPGRPNALDSPLFPFCPCTAPKVRPHSGCRFDRAERFEQGEELWVSKPRPGGSLKGRGGCAKVDLPVRSPGRERSCQRRCGGR